MHKYSTGITDVFFSSDDPGLNPVVAEEVPPRYLWSMSTITAILEPDVDGSLHLPLPADLRHGKIKVVATLLSVESDATGPSNRKGFGCLKGKISMAPNFDEPLDDFKDYME
jgi:hypothetical protein